MIMFRLLKDPLLHFVVLGALLFGGYQWMAPADGGQNAKTIVVDRAALLTFIQYRSKAFEPQAAARQLDAMTAAERAELVRDFVHEEALYREALALGMMENDYIIRRRSVQKLEFIAQGIAAQTLSSDPERLTAYYDSHRQDYYEAPSLTFTHIYLDAAKRGHTQASEAAGALLEELNRDAVGFSEATGYGDRFLYQRNYVERTPEFVASHFGQAFNDRVLALAPSSQWQGPIASDHGEHLVLLTAHQPGRYPELAEIQPRVAQDDRQWQQQQQQELAIQQIVDQYHVENRL